MPEQAKFNFSLYNSVNPLSPHFIYECIKRIFSRKSHDCLSSENKPKVIEVILKFAKLYDGVDFNNENQLLSYFDHYVKLEFMKFNDRNPIAKETIECLVEAYNRTPPNFVPPSDDVINYVINAVDKQILFDHKEDEERYQ